MKYGICGIWVSAMLWGSIAGAADTPRIEFAPENPKAYTEITYRIQLDKDCGALGAGLLIDYESHTIKIAGKSFSVGICPPTPTGSLGRLPPGSYQVEVYNHNSEGELFAQEDLMLTTELEVADASLFGDGPANHESPAEGSIQSGIGIIRGWTCDATKIAIIIDDKPYIAGYGVSRGDTRKKCGDIDNGYSLLVNWGLFSEGWHTMSVWYADAWGQPYVQLGETTRFQVVRLGQSYYKNLERTVNVSDFPEEGENVTLQWSTPDQNFKIIRHQR